MQNIPQYFVGQVELKKIHSQFIAYEIIPLFENNQQALQSGSLLFNTTIEHLTVYKDKKQFAFLHFIDQIASHQKDITCQKQDIPIPQNIGLPFYRQIQKIIIRNFRLASIETLSLIDCSHLKGIELQNTYVDNIKSLSKCNWKSLQQIRLLDNRIVEYSFDRTGLAKAVWDITISHSSDRRNKFQIKQNMSMFAKSPFDKDSIVRVRYAHSVYEISSGCAFHSLGKDCYLNELKVVRSLKKKIFSRDRNEYLDILTDLLV